MVIVKVFDVADDCTTVMLGMPTATIRADGILTRIWLSVTENGVSVAAPKWTVASEAKLVPVSNNVKSGLPANVKPGATLVISTVDDLVIGNVTAFDVPDASTTVTLGVPAVATSVDGTVT